MVDVTGRVDRGLELTTAADERAAFAATAGADRPAIDDTYISFTGLLSNMYQLGHYGVALLAYAPLGAVVAVGGHEAAAIVGALVCVGLSTLPDCDHRLPVIEHRGPTHTVLFALLVGAALAAGAAALIEASSPFADVGFVAFAFVVGAVSIGSHLLADALTPMGIRPFWPVSRRHYTLGLTRAANPIANYALLGLGIGAVVVAATIVAMLG